MKISKWKMIQLAVLLLVVLAAIGFIQGKSIYEQEVAKLEAAKKTFGN